MIIIRCFFRSWNDFCYPLSRHRFQNIPDPDREKLRIPVPRGWFHLIPMYPASRQTYVGPSLSFWSRASNKLRSHVSAIHACVQLYTGDVSLSFFHSGEHFLTFGATFFLWRVSFSLARLLFAGATSFRWHDFFSTGATFFLLALHTRGSLRRFPPSENVRKRLFCSLHFQSQAEYRYSSRSSNRIALALSKFARSLAKILRLHCRLLAFYPPQQYWRQSNFCPTAMPCWWGLTRSEQLPLPGWYGWSDCGLVFECVTCFYCCFFFTGDMPGSFSGYRTQ